MVAPAILRGLRYDATAVEASSASSETIFPALTSARRQAFRNISRSALIVSACVVGMPCGKPL
jgi:hypothetical protein